MIVLGLETSCDETAAAVVDGTGKILSHSVLSQAIEHQPYGGVVPEIAARSHLSHLDKLVTAAMTSAGINYNDIAGVAATGGPGLIGGILVGVMTAKAIAAVHNIPFLAVNHLEGHALTARLTDGVKFPYLLLLVSGGHCQLLVVQGVGSYHRLGTTLDDAAGEVFDKVAKMLGLGYPGGPAIELAAQSGDAGRFNLPRPMKGRPGCNFSFSGLKTAVRQTVEMMPPGELVKKDVSDLAASFQMALIESVSDRMAHALAMFRTEYPHGKSFVVSGGVAANTVLRATLKEQCAKDGLLFVAPPVDLCTDNAVMIAWAGLERLRLGLTDPLSFKPQPRWPLDPNASAAHGVGTKD
ncbi:MAG: tRNA (adenosine(37)-N6)-threonylcarbamoyltransferase complex transferase subunit TsaD [Candidatus Marinimicrobia bacterium]|nr:tRNA (adenosine(37)-N6)-threonylcarbamoyltransferase complex transferase subunit TsaD [Candidatus Neomarinimicrobiota bacterium]